MYSKAIAKAFLAINVVSFLIVTAIILLAMVFVPPPPNVGPGGVYLAGILLLVVNTIAHGLIALAGAFLAELERIRRAVEDIKALWERS